MRSCRGIALGYRPIAFGAGRRVGLGRRRLGTNARRLGRGRRLDRHRLKGLPRILHDAVARKPCLLYTSDAADE